MRTEPELAAALKMTRPSSVRAAMFRLSALTGWTSLPYLPSIRHQTLILCGDDDPVTPHVNHRVMARLIPSARLHTVRGGGHLVLLDSAHEVGPVISAFLHGTNEQLVPRAARGIPSPRSAHLSPEPRAASAAQLQRRRA